METPAFFAGFLHPSLLHSSPLGQILDYLNDTDINSFCNTDHATQSFIWPRMVMKEAHQVSRKEWIKINERHGPIIRCIQLNGLTDLQHIPTPMRNQIKQVRFEEIGGKVAREWIPSKLEVFTSMDSNAQYYGRYLRGPEIPVLPATIQRFCFGFHMKEANEDDNDHQNEDKDTNDREDEDDEGETDRKDASDERMYESAIEMIKRVLSQATQLRDVSISVEEGDLIAALPPTVERLSVLMYISEIGVTWPASLKHLTVQMENESEVGLANPIVPPLGLISLSLPSEWEYPSEFYEHTMRVVSELEGLREISFGPGMRSYGQDLFAQLPRNITSVNYNGMSLEYSAATNVNSLPDSVEELKWALNNDEVIRWPSRLRVLKVLGEAFAQDIANLPNTVTTLLLPFTYIRPVSKWPNSLTELRLGPQFMDMTAGERLPPTLRSMTMSLPLARRLMKSGKLPVGLQQLTLFGCPNPTIPFDVYTLPSSLRLLIFDGELPTGLNKNERIPLYIPERPHLYIHIQQFEELIKEEDMEVEFTIFNDSSMSRADIYDEEETIPFFPTSDNDQGEILDDRVPDPAKLQSTALFYTEPTIYDYWQELAKMHELRYFVPSMARVDTGQSISEILERLAHATSSEPIHGLLIEAVTSPPLWRAVRDALLRGAIVGSFSMIECKSAPPKPEMSFWTNGDDSKLVEIPPPPSPFMFIPDDHDPIKAADVMIQLLAALPLSNIIRLKIMPGPLFESDYPMHGQPVIETKEEGVDDGYDNATKDAVVVDSVDVKQLPLLPRTFTTLCASISRMTTLRTLVFRTHMMRRLRRRYNHMDENSLGDTPGFMELLVRTILQSPHIENVDLGDNTIGLGISSLVELIKQTKSIKRLVLSNAEIKISGIHQLCQAVIVNESLVSLNLAGNPTSLAGLNVIRHALRHNPRIEITVCHRDFGSGGLEQLRQKRHRRLKESRRVYDQLHGCISGEDRELE